jgi:hypothetical protein
MQKGVNLEEAKENLLKILREEIHIWKME